MFAPKKAITRKRKTKVEKTSQGKRKRKVEKKGRDRKRKKAFDYKKGIAGYFPDPEVIADLKQMGRDRKAGIKPKPFHIECGICDKIIDKVKEREMVNTAHLRKTKRTRQCRKNMTHTLLCKKCVKKYMR